MQERERPIVTGLVLLLVVLTLGFYVHRDPRFPGSLTGGVLGISAASLILVPLVYLLLIGVPLGILVGIYLAGRPRGWKVLRGLGGMGAGLFLLGAFAAPWIGNFLISRRPTR